MAKNPDTPKKPAKPRNRKPQIPRRRGPTCSRSGRRWRNCSIPRSIAAKAASAPPPDCSRRRIIPGTAAPAAKPPRIARGPRRRERATMWRSAMRRMPRCLLASTQPPRAGGVGGGGSHGGIAPCVTPRPDPPPQGGREQRASGEAFSEGFDESPQREFAPANYGTAATIPTLDPELAKQLGFTTEEEDAAALARPPRNKMEALGVAATADALDALIRDGRPEFKGEDGQVKIWTPHRPPRPEKSEGGVPLRHQVRIRAEGRPADRDQGTGRGHQRATTAPRCCSASPAPARPTPWPR